MQLVSQTLSIIIASLTVMMASQTGSHAAAAAAPSPGPAWSDPAVSTCGNGARRLRHTRGSYCLCRAGHVAINVTNSRIAERTCPPTVRRAHFLRRGIGHCKCVLEASLVSVVPSAINGKGSGAGKHLAYSDPQTDGQVSGTSSRATVLDFSSMVKGSLPSDTTVLGWTDLYTHNAYGWWDGPEDKTEGTMTTRSHVVHGAVVTQCQPGRLVSFEYVATHYALHQDKTTTSTTEIDVDAARPITLHGMHNGHPIVPHNVKAIAVPLPSLDSATSTASVTMKPIVLVLFSRRRWTNRFQYGTLRWSVHTLALCGQAAALHNLPLSAVTCYPVATYSGVGASASTTVQAADDEGALFRSFQQRVFGRGFHDACDSLVGTRILAITYGEAVTAFLNYPFGSVRFMARRGPRHTPAETRQLSACTQRDTVNTHTAAVDEVACRAFGQHNHTHGLSTDLPMFMTLRPPMHALRQRVLGLSSDGIEVPHVLPRRVALFHDRHACLNPGCFLNLEDVRVELEDNGFEVVLVDWDSNAYNNYTAVVDRMQNITISVSVEGPTALHALWMPEGRSGFLQLQSPYHSGIKGAIDLHTEAWLHYYGICVHNWFVRDVRKEPIEAGALTTAVTQLYGRLAAGTCRTCLVEPSTGLCRKTHIFN
eukprot:m.208023 g.208023  ORF g.208023 m.208023 type:complete len:651 (+) comp23999_c0_seq1:154-2106(+)